MLDDEKHYWVDESEVAKLERRGADWLPSHPERALIARRYLKHERRLYNPLLASFAEQEHGSPREDALEERAAADRLARNPDRLAGGPPQHVVGVPPHGVEVHERERRVAVAEGGLVAGVGIVGASDGAQANRG